MGTVATIPNIDITSSLKLYDLHIFVLESSLTFKNSTATTGFGNYMTDILQEQQQLFEKYLNFHEDLLKVQVKNMQRLVAIISFKKLNKINVDDKLKNGQHIVTPQNLIIDEKELEEIFDEIVPVIKKYYRSNKELKKLEDLNDKRKFSLKILVENIVTHEHQNWEDLAAQLSLSKRMLFKIGEYISTPYLELCAEYFTKKIQNKKWEQPKCPICGSHPSMALVNDQSEFKTLWCQLCDTEWKFKTDTCPFCNNNDLKTAKFIFPPDKSPHRIDACDNCETYLKTIDEQMTIKKPNFVVEYLTTYHLDLLALETGYHRYTLP